MFEYLNQHERLRIEALSEQICIGGDIELAKEIDRRGELISFPTGTMFIEQNTETNDVFFILSGFADIIVNGRTVSKRGPKSHVGEMAAIQPTQRRSASAVAIENIVAVRLAEVDFSEIASQNPKIYRSISKELARRLLERNSTINQYRANIKVFIISSAEALPIARLVQNAFEHDPFMTVLWTNGVFKIANYPLQDLESQIDDSDFAIAIAHADDLTESRGQDWPSPRDNVVFELGLFMGRLGRSRAILMEPREERVKLPSDLAGITTITYTYEKGGNAAALLAPACNRLRDHVNTLGPNNG